MEMEERPFHTLRLRRNLPGLIGPSADLYLQSLKMEGKMASTRYEYHRELELLAAGHMEAAPGDFTPFDVQTHLAHRCEGIGRPGEIAKELAQNSRRKIYAVMAGYFGWLHDQGAITANPMRAIRRPAAPEPEPTFWTPDEVRRMLAAPCPARDRIVLELFARTGQRMTPIRLLTWDRVHLVAPHQRIVFPRAKGGKHHTLPIGEEKALLMALVFSALRRCITPR
jgi:integrase